MTLTTEKVQYTTPPKEMQQYFCNAAKDRLEIAPAAFLFVVLSSVRVRHGRK